MKPQSKSKDRATLRPVHPNAGIEAQYRRKLVKLISEMNASVEYWLKASYRANEPLIAQDDALPSIELRSAVRKLAARWQRQFNRAATELAQYFALAVSKRSDAVLRTILRKGGFSVRFTMTPAARDILQATVSQNVSLIKSIPSRYFTNVEGMVMRSVQTGRGLQQLTTDLHDEFGITKRRAANIARDQNNKATAAITRARQDEIGVTEGVWVHSGGGKHPRPTHVAMSGKTFKLKQGMYDPAVKKFILPGEEINCRCIWRAVIPGFT